MKKTIIVLLAATGMVMLATVAAHPTIHAVEPDIESETTLADDAGTLNDAPPEHYDSMINTWRAANITPSYEDFYKDFINIDSTVSVNMSEALPDSVYAARLRRMVSPIYLPYNDIIKKYLVVYTTTRRTTMARILGLSQYYFPMIEQELANAGLPLELRMLPVIESALSPTAVSRAGATGLWQFMYNTGKNFGLEITSFVDERRDPVAATHAACLYLKYLYGIYGDWTLAIAAYNCGPGNVNKALKRVGDTPGGTKSYWDIYPYLPAETRGYLPSFVAATYAYNYAKLHNIIPIPAALPLSTDTVRVSKMMHLEQVSSTINTPIEVLRELNPQYKLDIIPAVDKNYSLTLPSSQVMKYIQYQNEIAAKDTIYLSQYIKNPTAAIAATSAVAADKAFTTKTTTYKVKSGDTLGSIAKRYGVTVAQIMKWNHIKSATSLKIGQALQIYK